ncbi:chloride channel protein [Panacibacter ginsenosidivorans]|uniref:Chloride channel protein n=1 Tax=Panacibacter ginsenosidivorans TaxID=1813871 RepID=A0A5B8V678_9BACT|nr:chloride channel protein [Panacibacter ginsenosidivorans]QEC66363.1 chloride channel protein [Panacibacter ginsenosidivorans]
MTEKRSFTEAIPLSPSLDESFGSYYSEAEKRPVSGRVLLLSLQAIFNALVIGVIAKGLVMLIDLITNISFYRNFSFAPSSPAHNTLGWMVVLVPVTGSIIIGFMARFGSSAIRGHGIPEAMEKIITGDSKIPIKLTFLKPLSAAISIGTGGPFGAEGPIIATGGAFGSVTGQLMRISSSERKIMLAAGACAGMSAIFGSPLAAILLAIELLLFEFSPRSVIPVALSCAAGAVMHLLLFSSIPVFQMPDIPIASGIALTTYVILGAVIGVIASVVSKSVYLLEDAFEKLPIHWMWWPAIGAIAVGVIGYFAPITLGVGYTNISGLLTGNLPLTTLLILCILKYISWVIALGSGTSGGTLAPLFTIGGATGALLGTLLLRVFPGSDINIATAALIGMAAMFAGASRALLTSIVFLLETTGQPHTLLPLIGACTAAYFVSFFLMKGSIMTERIERRGIRTPGSYKPDVLQHINADEVMDDAPVLICADNSIADLKKWTIENISAYKLNYFIVTDKHERFIGYIERSRLLESKEIMAAQPVQRLISTKLPVAYEKQDLAAVSELMGTYNMQAIAVIAKNNNNQNIVKGIITPTDILKAYSNHHKKEGNYHVSISFKRRAGKLMIKGRLFMQSKFTKEDV